MKRGDILDSIPTDIVNEIFLRLPAKSIARFRCVSKLWGSMLCCPFFNELFLTRSSARPRLLFGVFSSGRRHGEWLFFSSPQPQNPYDKKSSHILAADFHIKFTGECRYSCSYASGLLCFQDIHISKHDDHDTVSMICNPMTGQHAILPKLSRYEEWTSFLGFDPIDKQFKVLSIAYPYCDDGYRILTLGTGKMMWRKIYCPLSHILFRRSKAICINGVLYYLAIRNYEKFNDKGPYVIVCFHVRSEKFKFLDATFCGEWPMDFILINYKGKLGGIILKHASDGGFPLELCVWVLEDIEKQQWSKYVYTLWDKNKVVKVDRSLFIDGMTTTGEIVLSVGYTSKPFYVFYFNPERNTLQSIEIKGFGEYLEALEISGEVYTFVDHVEDLNVNNTKQLRSNPLYQGLNIIRKRPKPKRLAPSMQNKQPAAFTRNKYELLANLE